jgi:hypothetical protein
MVPEVPITAARGSRPKRAMAHRQYIGTPSKHVSVENDAIRRACMASKSV